MGTRATLESRQDLLEGLSNDPTPDPSSAGLSNLDDAARNAALLAANGGGRFHIQDLSAVLPPAPAPQPTLSPQQLIAKNLSTHTLVEEALDGFIQTITAKGQAVPFGEDLVAKKLEAGPPEKAHELIKKAQAMEVDQRRKMAEGNALRAAATGRSSRNFVVIEQEEALKDVTGIEKTYDEAKKESDTWSGEVSKMRVESERQRAQAERNLAAQLSKLTDVDGNRVLPLDPKDIDVKYVRHNGQSGNIELSVTCAGIQRGSFTFERDPSTGEYQLISDKTTSKTLAPALTQIGDIDHLSGRIVREQMITPALIDRIDRIMDEAAARTPLHAGPRGDLLKAETAQRISEVLKVDFGFADPEVRIGFPVKDPVTGKPRESVAELHFALSDTVDCSTQLIFAPDVAGSANLNFKGTSLPKFSRRNR